MALNKWDQRLEPLISGGAGNLMLVGPRKSGKSVLCATLLKQAARLPQGTRPDLVICCSGGSQADYVPIIGQHWDKRFLFNRLPGPEFMDALFDQQRAYVFSVNGYGVPIHFNRYTGVAEVRRP
mgnify:CR=1 FL=1